MSCSVVQLPGSQELVSRQRRAVEREGRRRRRREVRERGEVGERGEEKGKEEHRQGMSTDDELLEMHRLKFENNMSKLEKFLSLAEISLSLSLSLSLCLQGRCWEELTQCLKMWWKSSGDCLTSSHDWRSGSLGSQIPIPRHTFPSTCLSSSLHLPD